MCVFAFRFSFWVPAQQFPARCPVCLPANTLLHHCACCCTQILRYPSPDFVPVTNTHQATNGPFTRLPYDTNYYEGQGNQKSTVVNSAVGAARSGWAAHLLEHLVQPLERPMQMHLDPARSREHILPSVLHPPALDEGHADGAHSSEGVHRLEALVDALSKQSGKLLVVEDLEVAAGGDLADGGRVPAVLLIAIGRLDEDGRVREAFGEHLPADVVQPDALPDVLPRLLNDIVPVDVGEDAEAEPFAAAGVGEPVDSDVVLGGVEVLPDARVHLVVGDAAPVGRLGVGDGLHINIVWELGGWGGRGEVCHRLASRRNVPV